MLIVQSSFTPWFTHQVHQYVLETIDTVWSKRALANLWLFAPANWSLAQYSNPLLLNPNQINTSLIQNSSDESVWDASSAPNFHQQGWAWIATAYSISRLPNT